MPIFNDGEINKAANLVPDLYILKTRPKVAVLRVAESCHRDAAWMACSWGMFQELGTNHLVCGFQTVEAFVQAMESGAPAHLDAFVGFVRSAGLADELRKRDWAAFARGYNGPGFAANAYDTKMAAAYRTLAVR